MPMHCKGYSSKAVCYHVILIGPLLWQDLWTLKCWEASLYLGMYFSPCLCVCTSMNSICFVIFRYDKLKLHSLKHTDLREFMCENCGRQFKRRDKLREHVKRMHAPGREKIVRPQYKKKFVPKVTEYIIICSSLKTHGYPANCLLVEVFFNICMWSETFLPSVSGQQDANRYRYINKINFWWII